MARRLAGVDAVIVGLGWTGSIIAKELTDAGLRVVAVERGPWRDTATDFPTSYAQDELRYRIRHDLFLRPAQDTLTFRNKAGQTALPVRTWGSFMLGNGVGGGGVHWNAECWRFLPSDLVLRPHVSERYGAGAIPEHMTIQDWGATWAELEPHHTRFEQVCGTSGTAGNLRGAKHRHNGAGTGVPRLFPALRGRDVYPQCLGQCRPPPWPPPTCKGFGQTWPSGRTDGQARRTPVNCTRPLDTPVRSDR